MVCNNCGTQLSNNDKFCPTCGIGLSTNNYNNYSGPVNYTKPQSKPNNTNTGLVVALVIMSVILLAGICTMSILFFADSDKKDVPDDSASPMPTQTEQVRYAAPVFSRIEASSTRDVDMTSGVAINYFPSYAVDGDFGTTWSPDRNYGLTPSLTLYADSKQHVNGIRMANGYFKNTNTYTRNRRITKVRIEYEGGYKEQSFGIDQYRVMQDIQFDTPVDTSYIRIQVLETHYGDWKDICISEVEVY